MRLVTLLLVLALAACSPAPPPPNNVAPEPPTRQAARPSMGGTRVTWTNPTDEDLDAMLVTRFVGRSDGKPAGTVPQVGSTFGAGTVLYNGTDQAVFDPMLPPACTTATYSFWSHDKAGHWSEAAVEAVTLPGGLPPPTTPPSNLTANLAGSGASLMWTNPPPATGATRTKVVRSLGSPPTSPDQGTLVFDGAGNSFTESLAMLPTGQTIFYAAFACNACSACAVIPAATTMLVPSSDGGTVDAGPEPDGGTAWQPSGLTAQVSTDGVNVNLAWTNASPAGGFTQVKVLRQLNSPPIGPNDTSAVTLFTGLATVTSERVDRLLPAVPGTARTYHYAVFGCANALCEGQGTRATFTLSLSQALHGGGYTIWWRHASASTCGDLTNLGACVRNTGAGCSGNWPAPSGPDWCCPGGSALNWWKSCDSNCTTATARQLTPPQSTLETTLIHNTLLLGHRKTGSNCPCGSGEVCTNNECYRVRSDLSTSFGRVISSELCRAIGTAQGFDFGPAVELSKDLTYFVFDEANRCTNTYLLLNETPSAGTNTAMVSHAGFSCPLIDSLAWGECAIFRPVPGGQPTFITRVPYNGWASMP